MGALFFHSGREVGLNSSQTKSRPENEHTCSYLACSSEGNQKEILCYLLT